VVTRRAAERRFRPILLTAVTTFLGLGPMIFETNEQALFLVPMAISLGVGTLASSLVVLILVPVGFVISEELAMLKTQHPSSQQGEATSQAVVEASRH
jgi:multidrug efflux pump subunit AcrB